MSREGRVLRAEADLVLEADDQITVLGPLDGLAPTSTAWPGSWPTEHSLRRRQACDSGVHGSAGQGRVTTGWAGSRS